MNKRKKFLLLAIFLMISVSFSGFALTDLEDVQIGVGRLSKDLAQSLPFNSTIGLNWSDAYIGKFLPSVPPHFGVGLALGFTSMEFKTMRNLTDLLGYSLPGSSDRMFLPVYTAEARLGGFFLPFDVGFKFGMLPETGLWFDGFKVNYLLVGGDIRYAVMEGNVILPKISVGVGFNYLSGGISAKGSTVEINHTAGGGGTIEVPSPGINLEWHTYTLDFKAQISKSFLIVTPYLGLGGSYGWSSAGYSIDANIDVTGANYEDIRDEYGIDIDDKGMSSSFDNNAFVFRAFGGLSLNLTVFRIDFSGLYNFSDGNFGASLGLRFQL